MPVVTLKDITDSSCLSGYKFVGYQRDKRTKPYHAQIMDANGPRKNWYGPWRATALEAAQDYLDHINAAPLTIEDIRNPTRKSGFEHVNSAVGGRGTQAREYALWRASWRTSATDNSQRGPSRRTSEEAAQDYVDWYNSQRPQQPSATPALKTAGHVYDIERTDRDPEVEAALGVLRDARAQRQGRKGYVYCIIESVEGGGFSWCKIGYSVNPQKRVAELQTGNPRPLKVIALKEGTPADEKALHAKYIEDNMLQEWFAASPELMLEFDRDADGVLFSEKAKSAKS